MVLRCLGIVFLQVSAELCSSLPCHHYADPDQSSLAQSCGLYWRSEGSRPRIHVVELDSSFTTRWKFGTRPTFTNPPQIKVAVEGLSTNPNTDLLGVYFDGAISQKFAVDYEKGF